VIGCLDENTLAELIEGRLSSHAWAGIDDHLEGCADCRAIVRGLARGVELTQPRGGPPIASGARIGRYVLLGSAGAGGMGVVYGAYDPQLERKVALKFLRPPGPGEGTREELRERIQREAKAMARLSHPNVVTVHDVVVSGDEVFVAMEYVDGVTLSQWLQQRPRTWREIVAVFIEAGRGLAAAHAAGIVHRDFKPGNVLVGGDGRVRVTDFGLARAAGNAPPEGAGGLGGGLFVTQTGALLGTPAYMAPEQFRREPADARTDVFSFCAALWEALHGERPFRGDTLEALRAAVLAGRLGEKPPRAAPVRLRRILARGLSPRREDRHQDMPALLRELSRDPARTARWVVLASVSLAGAAAAAYWLSREEHVCRGAEQRLAAVWDAPRKAAIRAAFLAVPRPYAADAWQKAERGLDEYTADWAAMHTASCEATRVTGEQSEALLDLRTRCLEQRRNEIGALTTLLASADADIVTRAPHAVRSLRSLRDCADGAALQALVPVPRDPAMRARVDELQARFARVQALRQAGKYRDGEIEAGRLIAVAKGIGYRPAEAEALVLWGRLLVNTGAYQEAVAAQRQAIWAAEAGRDAKLAAIAWAEMGWAESYAGNNDAALQHLEHATAILEGIGDEAEIAGLIAHNRGGVLLEIGRHEEAFEQFEAAIAKRSIALGPDHPQIASSVNNLGVVRARQGRREDSLQYFLAALAIQEAALGEAHPLVGHTLFNVADAEVDLRRYADARAHAERAYRVLDAAVGPEHPLIASALNVLAIVATRERRFTDALRLADRAVAMGERTRAGTDSMLASYYHTLGGARRGLGRYGAARASFQHALELHLANGGTKVLASRALSEIGQTLLEEGKPAEAVPRLREAVAIQQAEGAAEDLPHTRFLLAQALWHRPADRAAAEGVARESLDALVRAGPTLDDEAKAVESWLAARKAPAASPSP
jgi:tetratricopeptide (TPR) repeat protein/predicted Ser/Thr protein kinase